MSESMSDAWGVSPETDDEKELAAATTGASIEKHKEKETVDHEAIEVAGEEEVAEEEGTEGDPGGYEDTRERKDTYSADEYGKAVRARDYFRKSLDETHQRQRVADERLEKIQEALTVRDAEPIPDVHEEPAEFLAHQGRKNAEKMDEVTDYIKEERQQRKEAAEAAQYASAINAAEQAHIAEAGIQPEEFLGQVNAVRRAKIQDVVEEEGYDEQQATTWVLQTWEPHIVRSRMMQGQNPAKFFEGEFRRRKLTGTDPRGGAGATKEPVPPAVPTDEDANLQRIAKGQKAKKTAGGGGGRKGTTKLTYAKLAEMDQDEFNALYDKLKGTKKFDELNMGGTPSITL